MGNAESDFYDGDRVPGTKDDPKGVNLYTASVVALDADTGKLRWYYQEVPGRGLYLWFAYRTPALRARVSPLN